MEKKRMSIETKTDILEEELLPIIKNNDYFKKNYEDKTIFKSIFVKNRLINLIIK